MLGEIAYAMAPAQGQGGQQSSYMPLAFSLGKRRSLVFLLSSSFIGSPKPKLLRS